MKLFYIANIRFPTERAHGIQVAHMCAAFARRHGTCAERNQHGTDAEKMVVTLLVPNRKTIDEDPHAYYGVERNFTVEKIPVPDIVQFGKAGFLVESLIFAYRAARRAQRARETVIYTREELPLLFLPHGRAFYEAHQPRRSPFFKWLIRRARGIVAITQGLRAALVASGISEGRILVAHDGYDEKQFAVRISKEEARKGLGLPLDTKIAMYIGGLEAWKGAEILCKATGLLAQDGILVVVLGGANEEIKKLQSNYPAVRFAGARPYRELPINQQAADILVVPNSKHSRIGSIFTSPLKLFAHMASGVGLVVADVPALKEIVLPTQAFLFSPDDPKSLADCIRGALSPEGTAGRFLKAAEAKKRALDFTWDKRAKNVLAYMQLCLNEKESS